MNPREKRTVEMSLGIFDRMGVPRGLIQVPFLSSVSINDEQHMTKKNEITILYNIKANTSYCFN